MGKLRFTCKYCGKPFIDYRCNNKKYCSKNCYTLFQKTLIRDKANSWRGGTKKHSLGYVRIYCPEHPMSRERYVYEHRLVMEKHLGRLLTPEERVQHLNENSADNRIENLKLHKNNSCLKLATVRRGVENHMWKGGRSPIHELIRKSSQNKQWTYGVFVRDGFTCQVCGIKSGQGKRIYLEAHHKKRFEIILQDFLNEYSQFSPIEDKDTLFRLATSYSPFWDISNGITLCRNCHRKTYEPNKGSFGSDYRLNHIQERKIE